MEEESIFLLKPFSAALSPIETDDRKNEGQFDLMQYIGGELTGRESARRTLKAKRREIFFASIFSLVESVILAIRVNWPTNA